MRVDAEYLGGMEDGFLIEAELEAGGCGVAVQIDRELIECGELLGWRILDLLQSLQPLCTHTHAPGQLTTRIRKGTRTMR